MAKGDDSKNESDCFLCPCDPNHLRTGKALWRSTKKRLINPTNNTGWSGVVIGSCYGVGHEQKLPSSLCRQRLIAHFLSDNAHKTQHLINNFPGGHHLCTALTLNHAVYDGAF